MASHNNDSPSESLKPETEAGEHAQPVPHQEYPEGITEEQATRIKDSKKELQIEHIFFEKILQEMSLALATTGNAKPHGLIVIGDSDSGKSTLLKKFCKHLEKEEQKPRIDDDESGISTLLRTFLSGS